IEVFRNRLVQNLICCLQIFLLHLEFDASKEIGIEPVEAHHVVVGQPALDTSRIKASLSQQRLRHIPDLRSVTTSRDSTTSILAGGPAASTSASSLSSASTFPLRSISSSRVEMSGMRKVSDI